MRLLDDGAKKGKVMKELLMMKGAKTLVDVATKVQAGETVLLVTDYAKTDIAQAVAAVACDRGAEVMIMSMNLNRALQILLPLSNRPPRLFAKQAHYLQTRSWR